jgi:hypothetical protein
MSRRIARSIEPPTKIVVFLINILSIVLFLLYFIFKIANLAYFNIYFCIPLSTPDNRRPYRAFGRPVPLWLLYVCLEIIYCHITVFVVLNFM